MGQPDWSEWSATVFANFGCQHATWLVASVTQLAGGGVQDEEEEQ